MPDRYPGYDVLAKRDTPSWNDATRDAIDRRLAVPRQPRFLDEAEWAILCAAADRIVPQPPGRAAIPVAALVDNKLHKDEGEGYRNAQLPPLREAWRRGLHAMDEEARAAHGAGFAALRAQQQDDILRRMHEGRLEHAAWQGMPPALFFTQRLAHDIVSAYYGHPSAWNDIGWGGPASPRGYVRMDPNRRDPWEAAEAKPGQAHIAYEENLRVR